MATCSSNCERSGLGAKLQVRCDRLRMLVFKVWDFKSYAFLSFTGYEYPVIQVQEKRKMYNYQTKGGPPTSCITCFEVSHNQSA